MHTHPCQLCGAIVKCDGPTEENHDGFPGWICLSFHLPTGDIDPAFLCEGCWEQ